MVRAGVPKLLSSLRRPKKVSSGYLKQVFYGTVRDIPGISHGKGWSSRNEAVEIQTEMFIEEWIGTEGVVGTEVDPGTEEIESRPNVPSKDEEREEG